MSAIALLVLTFVSLDATAQITRPFAIRYSANINGDIKIVGNGLMTCPASADCTSAQAGIANPTGLNNNDFAMIDIDIDSDASTFNSSSATMTVPAGSTVRFAGLYWAATSASAQRGSVLFKTPASFGYSAINATVVDTAAGAANNYSGFRDVTAAVVAAGSGVYTVANVQRTLGATTGLVGFWWSHMKILQNP